MSLVSTSFNIAGLLVTTVAAIYAATCAPTVQYNADGSVSMIGNSTKEQRISMHRRQKHLPYALAFVGVGAALQLVGAILA